MSCVLYKPQTYVSMIAPGTIFSKDVEKIRLLRDLMNIYYIIHCYRFFSLNLVLAECSVKPNLLYASLSTHYLATHFTLIA